MVDLSRFAQLVPLDNGLAVVVVSSDGKVHTSVVNAGVLDHPISGDAVVGLVAAGGTKKLRVLRKNPRATVVLRAGWQWSAVDGPVELIGPDDPVDGVDAERLRLLLREIFSAAGGAHDDWDEYDRVMATERRTAVLVRPDRVYGVP